MDIEELLARIPGSSTVLDVGCGTGVPGSPPGRGRRPGGWFLGVTGHRARTGTDENWLGGATPMWWSHPATTPPVDAQDVSVLSASPTYLAPRTTSSTVMIAPLWAAIQAFQDCRVPAARSPPSR